MLGALYYKIFKWNMPFGVSEKPGWAGDVVILGATLVLMFVGAGTISVDALMGFYP